MIRDTHVVVATDAFDADLAALTSAHGFRVDAIHPADAPTTAIVSAHGLRLRLERAADARPITVHLLSDDEREAVELPGGTRLETRPFTTAYSLPENRPSLVISRNVGEPGTGRAGMRYRDLLPDRWGGRFIGSHISIPDGGPIPDYVHFHKVRFQFIFVKSGWVRVVYEGQGEPFVMQAGDGVLQPPGIRHRVLESSPGLEVIEVGCPAEHETIADWSLPLPSPPLEPEHDFGGQRFVRHVASPSPYTPWRSAGWECRDTGIADATSGLAGVRVARPTGVAIGEWIHHNTEFSLLVVLTGQVGFEADGVDLTTLGDGDSAAIPGGTPYRLTEPGASTQLLDVTLPATFDY